MITHFLVHLDLCAAGVSADFAGDGADAVDDADDVDGADVKGVVKGSDDMLRAGV
jgi:hypothetical protein